MSVDDILEAFERRRGFSLTTAERFAFIAGYNEAHRAIAKRGDAKQGSVRRMPERPEGIAQ